MKRNTLGSYARSRGLRPGLTWLFVCVALAALAPSLSAQTAAPAPTQPAPAAPPTDALRTPDEALRKLMEGNERYVHNTPSRPDQTPTRRSQLALSQHPFAVILGCSDSRVAPELIFDQGLGDLFVVRVAGNVLDDEGLGSLEYAVEHLHAPLIVVLGHSKCGAVTAAVSGESAPGHIKAIVKALKPAVEATRGQPGDPVENAIKANVQRVVAELQQSKPILAEHLKNGTLKIVGGRYDLGTGAVELLDKSAHP